MIRKEGEKIVVILPDQIESVDHLPHHPVEDGLDPSFIWKYFYRSKTCLPFLGDYLLFIYSACVDF